MSPEKSAERRPQGEGRAWGWLGATSSNHHAFIVLQTTRLFLSDLSKNTYDSNIETYNDDWNTVNGSSGCVYHKSRCKLSIEIKLFFFNPAGIHRPSD